MGLFKKIGGGIKKLGGGVVKIIKTSTGLSKKVGGKVLGTVVPGITQQLAEQTGKTNKNTGVGNLFNLAKDNLDLSNYGNKEKTFWQKTVDCFKNPNWTHVGLVSGVIGVSVAGYQFSRPKTLSAKKFK